MKNLIFASVLLMTACTKKNKVEQNIYSRPQVDLEDLDYDLENDILPESEGDENEDNKETDSETSPE
tara:strand:+ start:359 stop:559 length:201 start_codon:yes stop_codon:yes gene_type:complete